MLGETPSSVIDTYTFIIHFHVHSLFHYVSARPAGITQLKTGVHPYNYDDCQIWSYEDCQIENTYISVARVVCLVEHKQNMSTGHLSDEGRNHPREQVIEKIGCIY